MIWTQSRIRELQSRAREAQKRIEELLANGVISIGNRHVWGQFLDDPRDSNQYGIYGTSASIQVLISSGHDSSTAPIPGAFKALQKPFEDSDPAHPFNRKGHFSVLYKMAFLAEAETLCKDESQSHSLRDELINRILPHGGWGDYFNSLTDKDVHPRITATAIALLSLRKNRLFRSMDECDNCLKWLCERMPQDGNLRTFEIALALLALNEYQDRGTQLSKYSSALEYCIKRLISWTGSRRKCQFGFTENYHYARMHNESSRNEYLFFLPDCLATLALLKQDSPNQARRYILKVVDFFTKEIVEKKRFTPESTKRVSSVDHLWLYRLLSEFASKPVELIQPYSYLHWVSANRFTRGFFPLLFLGSAILGFYLEYLNITSVSKSPFSWIIASVLAVIGSNLFAGTIFELRKGREP